MKISDYVNTDWLLYSSQNNLRSIPSLKDGQILTTRKLLFALKNQNEFEVVERLGLKAASMTAYKNGGSNISQSLAGMVKSFAGTNNVPMFDGEGQFGTAIENDASEVRYISAKISENYKEWFSPDDEAILPVRVERGDSLEYSWMAPIAPLALVNGSFGIGTGYASTIHCHHPVDVIEAVLQVLQNGYAENRLLPHWVGWKGKIERDGDSGARFFATGVFKRISATEVQITELPPQYNNARYRKDVLMKLLENDNVLNVSNDSNKFKGWDITIQFKRGFLSKLSDDEVVKLLDLRKSFSHVLYGWGFDDTISAYDSVDDILVDWTYWRLSVYTLRITHMVQKLERDIRWETLKKAMVEMFLNNGGKPLETSTLEDLVSSFNFGVEELKKLLDTPMRNLTKQGVDKQEAVLATLNEKLNFFKTTSPTKLMTQELETLLSKVRVKYPRCES